MRLSVKFQRLVQKNRNFSTKQKFLISKTNFFFNILQVIKLIKRNGEPFVQLTALSVFANQMYSLLYDHGGRTPLPNFESAYLNKFKKSCQPSEFGFPTLSSLLTAIPETVSVQNNGYYTHKRIIALNMDLKSKFTIFLLSIKQCR